eukprot:Skav215743  [mRNA]  locus=scaffold106:20958:23971:- [translate_table: standard]
MEETFAPRRKENEERKNEVRREEDEAAERLEAQIEDHRRKKRTEEPEGNSTHAKSRKRGDQSLEDANTFAEDEEVYDGKPLPRGKIGETFFSLPGSKDLQAGVAATAAAFSPISPDHFGLTSSDAMDSGMGRASHGKSDNADCDVVETLGNVYDWLEETSDDMFCELRETALPSWSDFFKVRGVDYKGDEVLTAQQMQWDNVKSALPQEVGGVALEQVVELGCRHYVLNFEEYLLPEEDRVKVKAPRVMVAPEHWSEFCSNLLKRGVFDRVHESDLPVVGDSPLLNGLFGVSKHEFDGQWEVMRIIMNLIPLNEICRSFDGDVSTLPSWAGMTPLHLQPHEELVVSSEDVRCFFYIFRVPKAWRRFLAFNRPLPPELCEEGTGTWYPCSAVLPMGFKNSVSLAQHVRRFIVKNTLTKLSKPGGEAELRKDRPFPHVQDMYRIYLDNFDQLEKTNGPFAESLKGSISEMVMGLREEYAKLGVPRHPKKAVSRGTKAEVQGAIVDGLRGVAAPKVEKIFKYVHLAKLLVQAGYSTQRQMQIIGGGFVYIAMFRRPLLGGLNHIWQFIVECEPYPPVVKFKIPSPVLEEIVRFIGLIPLAYMNFRTEISAHLTASDASEHGGGVAVTTGLTPMGAIASHCQVRGDVVEPADLPSVLTIGLFDGIAALRMAADSLGWCVVGHISVERSKEASRVVESRFAGSIIVPDVTQVDDELVQSWANQFTQVSLVVVGGGPPCQGVSGLNAARKGALRDERSCLFIHVARIRSLVRKRFPWAQVKSLMENVASMDISDQNHMSASFEEEPLYIDAAGVSLAHRPRLYWIDWEIQESPDAQFSTTPSGRHSVQLHGELVDAEYLLPGWTKVSERKFPTFTASRPGGFVQLASNNAKLMKFNVGLRILIDFLPINTKMSTALEIKQAQCDFLPLKSVKS